jgi:hypothetical protein
VCERLVAGEKVSSLSKEWGGVRSGPSISGNVKFSSTPAGPRASRASKLTSRPGLSGRARPPAPGSEGRPGDPWRPSFNAAGKERQTSGSLHLVPSTVPTPANTGASWPKRRLDGDCWPWPLELIEATHEGDLSSSDVVSDLSARLTVLAHGASDVIYTSRN